MKLKERAEQLRDQRRELREYDADAEEDVEDGERPGPGGGGIDVAIADGRRGHHQEVQGLPDIPSLFGHVVRAARAKVKGAPDETDECLIDSTLLEACSVHVSDLALCRHGVLRPALRTRLYGLRHRQASGIMRLDCSRDNLVGLLVEHIHRL